ncbi:hypothetical protein D4R75_09690 [bacterium]|nr:MAG: hypothetical protein D4R75_09690 [bacterium]
MTNSHPLLKFKEPVFTPPVDNSSHPNYDFELGYWIAEDGEPYVRKLINHFDDKLFGQTTKTATREGADQSESLFGQTIVTRTRESSDQSESVFGQTIATKTRESSDQSESAIPLYGQTLVTETREGVDRSERST